MTGAVAERFHDPETDKQEAAQVRASARRSKLKKSAWAVSKAAGRIGLSAVTFGATEILSDMGDEIARAASDEAKAFLSSDAGDEEAEKFWSAHDARIAAMEAFRLALTELTEPDETGLPQRKLVIVIDELDRCRPDYALSLLEIIKHFFNVDGVHFVLGVNLKELQNSVQARYGSGVDAAKYLQKFTSIVFPLVGPKVSQGNIGAYSTYFEHVAATCKFDDNWRYSWIRDYLLMIDHHALVGLRDIEKLVSQAVVSPKPHTETESTLHIYAGLSILRVIRPALIQKARLNQLDYLSVNQVFKLSKRSDQPSFFQNAASVWSACTIGSNGDPQSSPQRETRNRLGIPDNRLDLPAEIIASCFDAFVLSSDT